MVRKFGRCHKTMLLGNPWIDQKQYTAFFIRRTLFLISYNFARSLLRVELVMLRHEATALAEIRPNNFCSCSSAHISLSLADIPKKL